MASDKVKNFVSSSASTGESSNSSSPTSHVLQKSADQRQQSSSCINTATSEMHMMIKKKKSGRKKFRETRHPIYKGVRQRKGKWVCELRQPGSHSKSRLWLGTFSSPDMAARAYDVAALAIRGDSASLNFPESAGGIQQRHVGPSSSWSSPSSSASELALGRAPAAAADAEAVSEGNNGSITSFIFSSSTSSVSRNVYVDEEELFNMPGLLDSMAEGLILTPPSMQRGFSWDDFSNLEENYSEDYFSLWTD